jgi:hypothetical protein
VLSHDILIDESLARFNSDKTSVQEPSNIGFL